MRRNSEAVEQRRVSLRPAPDGTTRLSAVLPVVDGAQVWAEPCRTADTARAAGDRRSRGEVMADELVARVLGHTAAELTVEVSLVMTDAALLGSDDPVTADPPAATRADWSHLETWLRAELPA